MAESIFAPPELGAVLDMGGLPGGGGTIYDRSPYGNRGSITGAGWVRLPGGAGALAFDGVDDYVSVPHCPAVDIAGQEMTISAWIYVLNPTEARYNTVLGKRDGADCHYEVYIQASSGRLAFFNGGAEDQVSNYVVPGNRWINTIVVVSGGTTRFVINGALFQSVAGGLGSRNTRPLHIGNADLVFSEWFKGRISRICIFNRGLSLLECNRLFSRQKEFYGV